MTEQSPRKIPLGPRWHSTMPRVASSSSFIGDLRATDSPKLRVLVAANGSKEVSQALALVVRLSKNPKIETRAIIDEGAWPARRLSQETLVLLNTSSVNLPTDETGKHLEHGLVEFYQQDAFELCEWADMLVMAPINADTFAKMLHGVTDCLVLEILRSWDVSKKILLVPGMTTLMWENPMTKKQIGKIRRKWHWVRVMQPLLWHYDTEKGDSRRCTVMWDGFNDVVDVIKNQAELMTIGHDVDIAAAGAANLTRHHVKTEASLPPEIWALIFEYVGDWEVSRALSVCANLPRPIEWQHRTHDFTDEVQTFLRELEWTILTSSTPRIVEKLQESPKGMTYLSSLCVKLIVKFCLTDLLTYLETNLKDVFWSSFGQKLLPIKASAVYGRTEILEWWRTSPSFLSKDYTAEAMDGASKSGFLHVLDWWRKSGLPLKYTESALEQASSKGHILVLEWWKQASVPQPIYHHDTDRRSRASPDWEAQVSEVKPALQLKPGKALLAAAQNNQPLVLRWWEDSGIPVSYSESVAKIASAHGHVAVLDAWRELKGDKMPFDSQVLVGPTKNGYVDVLQWWKDYSLVANKRRRRVEYKTCDIEEALEDSVGSSNVEHKVRKWWARNGLNLSIEVSEWTKVKVL